MDERQLRMACLEQTIRFYGGTAGIKPEDVAGAATIFFDFVKDGTMPPKAEVTD